MSHHEKIKEIRGHETRRSQENGCRCDRGLDIKIILLALEFGQEPDKQSLKILSGASIDELREIIKESGDAKNKIRNALGNIANSHKSTHPQLAYRCLMSI